MLLAVDVGNTQTVFGLYEGAELGERWRIATEAHRTGDELGALLADFLDLAAIDGICLSSTVPRLVPEYEHVRRALGEGASCSSSAPVCAPGSRSSTTRRATSARTGSSTRSQRRSSTARRRSSPTSAPRRTSTSSRRTGAYVGGVLAPGIEVSMEALFERAARLVKVDYVEPPR